MSMDRVTDDPVNAYHRTSSVFLSFSYVIYHLDVDSCVVVISKSYEIEILERQK